MVSDMALMQQKMDKLNRLKELRSLKATRDTGNSNVKPVSYTAPESGDDSVFIQSTGETIKAPAGTGEFFATSQNSDAFDTPSTWNEEVAAQFEKNAAYVALTGVGLGAFPVDDSANIIAERSAALADVQERYPERYKDFLSHDVTKHGFLANSGFFLSHLDSIGRMSITSAANQVSSLSFGILGGAAGTAYGGVAGGAVGIGAGTFAGGVAVEIGAELDQIVNEQGYDTTNANDLVAFFSDKQAMDDARARALKKGIATSSVDAMFSMFGGKLLSVLGKGGGVARKTGATVADVTTQAAGEGVGEAAGRFAAEGYVDVNDAVFEALSGGATGAATTATGATIRSEKVSSTIKEGIAKGKSIAEVAKKVGEAAPEAILDIPKSTDYMVELVKQSYKFPKALAEQEVEQRAVEIAKIESSFEQMADALSAKEGGNLLPVPKKAETLSKFIKRMGGLKPDTGEALRFTAKESPNMNRVASKTGKLSLDKARELAAEAGFIEQDGDIQGLLDALEDEAMGINVVREQDVGQDVNREQILEFNQEQSEVNKDISALAKNIKGIKSAFREGARTAKVDVKAVQESIINALDESGLSANDKAKFIKTIKNTQNVNQLQGKSGQKIERRILSLLQKQGVRDLKSKIKSLGRRARKSNILQVDFKERIDELYKESNTGLTYDQLLEKAQKMQSMYNDGVGLFNEIQYQKKLQKERDIASLLKNAEPINLKQKKDAPLGERVSAITTVKNKFTDFLNKAQEINVAKNPMDVIFDMMDGGKNYKGTVFNLFKRKVDVSYSKYENTKRDFQKDVKALHRELKLKPHQYEKIGAYAVTQQDGGKKKLMNSGHSLDEVNRASEDGYLTKDEMKMYTAMRDTLDEMRSPINSIMNTVYNKNIGNVRAYFPFMTDFDKTQDIDIQDRLTADTSAQFNNRKNVKKGFTEGRVLGGKQKVRIDALNVFMNHVDNASYLIEMGATIKELGDIASDNRTEIAVGDLGASVIGEWVNTLARKGGSPTAMRGLDALRGNVGAAILGFKLSTIMVQPTALMDGSALIGGGNVANGIGAIADPTDKGVAFRKFLKDNIPEIRERVGDDPAYLDLGGSGIVKKAQRAGFWAMQNVDLMVASSVGAGAYMRSVKEQGLEVDLSNPNQEALEYAALAVRRTQASGYFKDVPPLISQGRLSGYTSVDRMIFQFQTFMLNRWSFISHDIPSMAKQGRTAAAMNAATFMVLATLSEVGLRRMSKEMLNSLLGGDDLDDWEESFDDEVIHAAVGQIPFVGSVVSSLTYGSNPIPAMSFLDNVSKKGYYSYVSKDGDKKIKHAVGGLVLGSGILFGVPGALQAEQATRELMTVKKKNKGHL